MVHRPHLDPFISCFQNDISLATEDQQACQEQRSSVSQSQTNTGSENMPRSRRAETDRATMDPPLTSAKTLVYWSGSSGRWDIYGLFWRRPVYRGAWQGPIVFPGPRAGPHGTNVD